MKPILEAVIAFFLLTGLLIYEVCLSSVKVLWWIYSRPRSLESEFFSLPLEVEKGWQKIFIAHFITLTPGTLSVDIEVEKNSILIHVLNRKEKEGLVNLIREQVEPLVKKLDLMHHSRRRGLC